jgi:putative Mg2+ transporter-C (MgtC) family protein
MAGQHALACCPDCGAPGSTSNMLNIDWALIGSHSVHLGIAYLLALPIGWEREQRTHSIGMRTFPLVAVAACGYVLLARDVFQDPQAQAKMIEGILAGMGFIGGGAILKNKHYVSGTATAAGIWSTGAIGMAVAWNRFEIAIILSLLTFITLALVERLKRRLWQERDKESTP